MAFYTARLDATYTYRDASGNEHDIPLVLYNRTLLYSQPERSWNLPMDEHQLVGRQWSIATPTGNASLSLSLHWIISRKLFAQAEAAARRLEYSLLKNRSGSLSLCEAYNTGIPLLQSRWDAVVKDISAAPCSLDDAPAIPGCHAHIKVDFFLSNPSF